MKKYHKYGKHGNTITDYTEFFFFRSSRSSTEVYFIGYFLYDNDLGTVTIFNFVIPLRSVQITHGKYNKSHETETFDCREKEKKEIYTIASRRKVLEKVR